MRLNARAAWLATAFALLAMALARTRFAPWLSIGQSEAWLHGVAAAAFALAALFAPNKTAPAGALLMLSIGGISALSPGWLGLATSAGAYVEPIQAAAYAAAGAALAFAKK